MVAPDYLCKEHLTTDNGILVEQNEVKYLGITFDNTFSFSSHINQITQKISKVVGILWKARSLPLNIKLKIYYSLTHTHLNYAILVWGNVISNNITRGTTSFEHVPISLKNLNTVHNKVVRALVYAKKRDPLSKIYRELNLLKLVDIYYYNLGTFTCTTFNEDTLSYIKTMFCTTASNHIIQPDQPWKNVIFLVLFVIRSIMINLTYSTHFMPYDTLQLHSGIKSHYP